MRDGKGGKDGLMIAYVLTPTIQTRTEVAQKSVKRVVLEAVVTRAASYHTCRHSFATHLLERGQGIRTSQVLLNYNEPSTTMIYTQVLNRGPLGVRSPADVV